MGNNDCCSHGSPVTDRSSAPENAPSSRSLAANTHRVEAVNRAEAVADPGVDSDESGGGRGAARRSSIGFDFRLTRATDAPTATATVLELFAGYLAAASHALGDAAAERLEVRRVVVDGTVSTDADAGRSVQSSVASVAATIHVHTDAAEAALERWRRTVRDAEATQDAVPTDATVSVSVTRVPHS